MTTPVVYEHGVMYRQMEWYKHKQSWSEFALSIMFPNRVLVIYPCTYYCNQFLQQQHVVRTWYTALHCCELLNVNGSNCTVFWLTMRHLERSNHSSFPKWRFFFKVYSEVNGCQFNRCILSYIKTSSLCYQIVLPVLVYWRKGVNWEIMSSIQYICSCQFSCMSVNQSLWQIIASDNSIHVTCHYIMSPVITSCHLSLHHVAHHNFMSPVITSCHLLLHHVNCHYIMSPVFASCLYIMSPAITSCHLLLHHVTCHYIMSPVITSCRLSLHHVTCHYIMSPVITSCRLPLHHVTCHYIMSPVITSCRLSLHHVACHYIILPVITSCHLLLHHVTCHYIMSPAITSCHLSLHHATCHYIMSDHYGSSFMLALLLPVM